MRSSKDFIEDMIERLDLRPGTGRKVKTMILINTTKKLQKMPRKRKWRSLCLSL